MAQTTIDQTIYAESNVWNQVVDEMDAGFQHRDSLLAGLLESADQKGLQNYICRVKKKIESLFSLPVQDSETVFEQMSVRPMSGYRIENVRVQSYKGIYIPVNVYVPDNAQTAGYPAVLVPIGHYPAGKRMDDIQILCANLALKGIIAAAFDPICQGERDLFPEVQPFKAEDDLWAVNEHLLVGNQAYLNGENLMSWFLWDGKKVIDYLCRREDVDCSRIGCAGQSGGGTQTQFLTVLDKRISTAACVQSVSRQMNMLRTQGIGDTEQSPFNRDQPVALDYADYIIAAFPKKILQCIGNNDHVFELSGARDAGEEIKRLYSVMEKEKYFQTFEDNCTHEFSSGTRRAVYRWFTKWFKGREEDQEIEISLLREKDLKCLREPCSWPADTIRNRVLPADSKPVSREKTAAAVRKLIDVHEEEVTCEKTRDAEKNASYNLIFTCRTSGAAFVKLYEPEKAGGGKIIHAVVDFLEKGMAKSLSASDNSSIVADIFPFAFRETTSKKVPGYDMETCLAYAEFVQGRTLVSRRLSQLLIILRWIKKEYRDRDIWLDASGDGGILALIAGLFEPDIKKITITGMPACFAQYCGSMHGILHESFIIPGILKYADLPQIAAALSAKVVIGGLTDSSGRKLSSEQERNLYRSDNITFAQ